MEFQSAKFLSAIINIFIVVAMILKGKVQRYVR